MKFFKMQLKLENKKLKPKATYFDQIMGIVNTVLLIAGSLGLVYDTSKGDTDEIKK